MLLAAGAVAWRWWTSDARAIHQALDELIAAVEKSGEETQLERFARARQFTALFANRFVVSASPYEGTIGDRQQLAGALDGYRASAERIAASASERELAVRENGTADLFATITLRSNGATGGRERFRARFAWLREEGGWRISEAEILERLESSGLFD